jgi:branched-chain amino acid transport system ATP-binding protein/urea transport system ATP-binding protein
MSEVLLETSALTMQFGGVKAVNAVDFKLAEGELRCLIGPNGAGKSTFFKLITGQLRPTSGIARYRNQRLSGVERHDIARLGLGIKTQVPSVFDGLSARENVWLAASRKHRGRKIEAAVDTQLERVQATEFQHKRVGQLAHGQRQLVELGMVLASEPDLILLDEPAAGMTQDETDRLADIIRDIHKTHSLIVVEHDMDFIRSIATNVTVFNQGSVLTEGPVAEVLADQRVRDVYLGKQVAA